MKLQPTDFQKIPIDYQRVNKFFNNAADCLETSKELLKEERYQGSLMFSYDAMLKASIALAQSYGIRAKQNKYHYLMAKLVERILPSKDHDIVHYYDRLRKKRHGALYDAKEVTRFEAAKAINAAGKYHKIIEEHVRDKDPQKRFKF